MVFYQFFALLQIDHLTLFKARQEAFSSIWKTSPLNEKLGIKSSKGIIYKEELIKNKTCSSSECIQFFKYYSGTSESFTILQEMPTMQSVYLILEDI